MFAQLSSVVALLAVANAAPVSVTSSSAEKPAPTGWATGYLEEYKEYNIRYKALNCSTQHNTTFEDCCHPLLANETLTIRADYCTPGFAANTTASAIYATETSNNTEVYTEYCEEATSVASAVASVVATATESISQVTLTSNSSTATVVVQFAPSSSAVSSYAAEATSAEWVAPSSSAAESSSSPYVAAAAVETSSYVEPTTSTWVAPTSTYVAPTTSEAPAPAATTPAASSGGDWKTGGHATYFYQNGNAGACGWYNPDSAKVIAINGVGPNSYWTDYSKASPDCGRWVTIVNENNGKTVSAMVADVCPTCTGNGESIDLSVGAFESIADLSEGQVSIKWKWN